MRYHIITIFPELFDSFLSASLLAKGREKGLIDFFLCNPRSFCLDKHRQVDDQIYGGGVGLLLKAEPILAALEAVVSSLDQTARVAVVFPSPSTVYFDQKTAHNFVDTYSDIILLCGRYEGIDYRVVSWCQQRF